MKSESGHVSRLKALLHSLKEKLRQEFPGLFTFLKSLKDRLRPAVAPDLNQRFTRIFTANEWRDSESKSGTGSNLEQTAVLRERLPALLAELGIRTLLDIPCGDFYWMQHMDLPLERYIGADIVTELVDSNRSRHASSVREFVRLDLVKDSLPKVDLVFCRDCLVHLSNENIRKAVANIKRSGSRYLLTTGFSELKENVDILNGNWRRLNLTLAPFFFPPPSLIVCEECTEENGAFHDKCLFLWELSRIP